ncbi:hypothetical protein HK098_003896 [Nowakowskiella sp. JEL0407]|nr:hypothetical protein HK098_003896 [Nowakowskiella sp. JEL0407]
MTSICDMWESAPSKLMFSIKQIGTEYMVTGKSMTTGVKLKFMLDYSCDADWEWKWLVDSRMNVITPQQIGASAAFLARKMLNQSATWTHDLKVSGLGWEEVECCGKVLNDVVSFTTTNR